MILVDTSIWVEHARQAIADLSDLLAREEVLGHPYVLGELALGGFKPATLRLLSELPAAAVATNGEVLELIGRAKFAGRGIGYVDAHLLTATRLTEGGRVWTRDKRMQQLADELGISAASPVRSFVQTIRRRPTTKWSDTPPASETKSGSDRHAGPPRR